MEPAAIATIAIAVLCASQFIICSSLCENLIAMGLPIYQEFSFQEVGCLRASTNKIVCCHFSSHGKLLASAGHDKKEHLFLITDVRFSPNSTRLATSSFDKTVRVWDADNPSYLLRTFTGHQTSVMSLDFNPNNEDLICSCDGDSEIRYWSVNQGVCTRAFKGGMVQTRFQPRLGRLLTAAAENVVSIFDIETETCIHSLQSLELWNMVENKCMTISAHDGVITALAQSPSTGMIASASHDKCVKLWK